MILKILFFLTGIFFAQGKNYIYLTIDDGPSAITSEICDILKKYNAKATFFVLGENVKRYPVGLKRIYEDGHLIGNHTYSHKNFYKDKNNLSLMRIEIKKAEYEIMKIIGYKPIYLRYPYGFYSDKAREIAYELGYKVVNWDFGYDWNNLNEEIIIQKYTDKIAPGKIILVHDSIKRNKMALRLIESIVKNGNEKNLTFVRLDEVR